MKKMLPLAVFTAFAIMGQVASVVVALAVEYAGYRVASILVFGVLYLVMYGVAWKLTVRVVDGVLVKKGYVEAAPAEPAQSSAPDRADAPRLSPAQLLARNQ